ncbi:NAD-dependent epimerase/dehydratase family protein [Nocardia sp. NPDC052566]|uniref:NAD-dependent epimerase/dehydratase family protein n=1 Tax=Nocardia sp. NPDC052566 TaxID=3364330 RepID=UPI0037C65F86
MTGATSDFGAVVIPRLLEDDRIEEVVGISRRHCGIRHAKFRHVRLDIRDPAIEDAFDGCDTVIHLAFVVSEIRDKKLTDDINIGGSINVLESAARASARHLVITSSVNAYGNPGTRDPLDENTFPMGDRNCYHHHGKAMVEHYVEWWQRRHPYAMRITVLRPTYIVGPHFANDGIAAMAGRFLAIPDANSSSFQYLHEDDLATAYHLVVRQPFSGVFNIAPRETTPVRRLAAMHGQVLADLPMKLGQPIADLLFALRLSKYSGDWITAGEPPVDASRFRRHTGWAPTLTSDEAAALMLLHRARPILDATFVPRRAQACETVLRPTTEFIAAQPGVSTPMLRPPEHHQLESPGGATVHVEHHTARRTPSLTVLVVPAPGLHARFYSHLAQDFDDDIDVLIVDQPGTGLSAGPRRAGGPAATARAVERAWRALGRNQLSETIVVMFAIPRGRTWPLYSRPELLTVRGWARTEGRLAALRRSGFAAVHIEADPLTPGTARDALSGILSDRRNATASPADREMSTTPQDWEHNGLCH